MIRGLWPPNWFSLNGSRAEMSRYLLGRFSFFFVALVFLVMILGLIPACASGNRTEAKEPMGSGDAILDAGTISDGDSLTRCTEPRPQICTREYRPVCAQLQDGRFKTFPTGCTACTDPDVAGFVDGACK